jgi:toxin ParE1/3/4
VNVVWLPTARRDLERIHAHIAQDNLLRAAKTVHTIVTAINRLADYPGLGRPGRKETTRELVISRLPYIAVYRDAADRVVVVRILHQAQKWP